MRKKGFINLHIVAAVLLVIFVATIALVPNFRNMVLHKNTSDNTYNLPPTSVEERGTSIGRPFKTGNSTSYKFLLKNPNGEPIRYDPCRPIHYVINKNNEPIYGEKTIMDSVAEVSKYSGLQFIFDGYTNEVYTNDRMVYQPLKYGKRWAPVLFTWSTSKERPDVYSDTAEKILGEGGSASYGLNGSPTIYVSGRVDIEIENLKDIINEPTGEQRIRAIVLHELGHVVGLDHPSDPWQIMFPEASIQVTDFNDGDKAGLYVAGSGPCNPKI